MSRRLIIGLLIVLIVGTIAGSAYFIIQRLRANQTPSGTTSQNQPGPGGLQEAPTGSAQVKDPTADDDNDGLNNGDEATWGTDSKNPDTDGDSYSDGEEVKANYNPTIPSPNDKLPPGFVPGRDLQPLQPAPIEPIAVDQFFQDNLDLTLGTKNYTDEYRQRYSEAQRSRGTLLTFTKEQSVVTQLPTPADKTIISSDSTSSESLSTYLSSVNSASIFSNRPLFQTAINDLFTKQDPSTIQGLAIMVRIYQEELIKTSVPSSAISLHKLLLGYSQLLAATFDQMARYNEDQVRAFVAMRQWEEADKKYIPLIEQEITRLEALQQ